MAIEKGISLSTDLFPIFQYSKESREIIEVNEEFEKQFCNSSKVVGRSLDEVTQPILRDDFTFGVSEREKRNYVFLQVEGMPDEMVELIHVESGSGDNTVFLGIMKKIFKNDENITHLAKSSIFDNEGDIFFLINSRGEFQQVNEAACLKLGYSKKELYQMSISEIMHPSIRHYVDRKWQELIRGGNDRGDFLLRAKEGAVLFAEYRAVANVHLDNHLVILRVIGKANPKPAADDDELTGGSLLNGIVLTDTDLTIRYVNDACLKIFGHDSKADMLGRPFVDLCNQSGQLLDIIEKLNTSEGWKGNVTAIQKDGDEINLKLKIDAVPGDNKADALIWQCALMDITTYLNTDQSFSKAEKRFKSFLKAAPDGILIVNEEGSIQFCNEKICNMLGYQKGELVGQPVEVLVPDSERMAHVQHRREYHESPHKRMMGSNLDLFAEHKDGTLIPVDIMLGPFEEGEQQTIIAIVRDITKYKEAKAKLEDEKRFTELLHNLTIVANENKSLAHVFKQSIQRICDYMEWPVGHVYLPADDGSGEFYPSDIWHIEDEEKFKSFKKMTMCTRFSPGVGMVGEVIDSGSAKWYMNANEDPGFVRRMPDIDLNIRACFGLPVMVRDEVVGVLEFFSEYAFPTDSQTLKKMTTVGTNLGRVVERKESEKLINKNINLLRQLFHHSPAGIIMLDENEKVSDVNQGFTKIFGYTPEELIGKKLDNRLAPSHLTSKAYEITRQTFDGKLISKETIRLHKNGAEVPVVIHTVPITMEDKVIAIYGMYVDVSDIKRKEEQLRDSLTEKKFLLEEIHHRVKNNLAIITSLLELQIHQTNDEIAKTQLKDSQSRIYSMALVHEHLYQMDSFSYLDLEAYIRSLAQKIESTFNDPETETEVEFHTTPVKVSLDQAITCGQLINELMTNAFKHAFPGQEKGIISVSIEENEGSVELCISDNGEGIPDDALHEKGESLGLKLVNTLTNQLEGKLEINNDEGTAFIVCFPREEIKSQSKINT